MKQKRLIDYGFMNFISSNKFALFEFDLKDNVKSKQTRLNL